MVAMNENDLTIMGKKVSDMYGSRVGKAIGTTTDIDGTVISVGVDCGYRGLLEVPYEHLVVQEDSIIYIPQWRLDSQKVLRMKGLIIRRLRALNAILLDNDQMKDDSEAVLQGYEEKLAGVNESEGSIRGVLAERLEELDKQSKMAKSLLFDATIQYKSSEIHETDYKVVKSTTATILERIDYETSEIKNMGRRLDDLAAEEGEVFDKIPHPEPIVEEEHTFAESASQPELQAEETAPAPPEVPAEPTHEEPVTIPPEVPAEATYAPAEATYAPSEPTYTPPEVPAEATYAPSEPTYTPPEVPAEATYAPSEPTYTPPEAPAEPAHEEPTTIPPEVPAEATYAPAEATYAPSEPTYTPSEAPAEPAHEEPTTIPPEVPAEATYAPAEATYAPSEPTYTPSEVPAEPAHEEPVTIPPEVPAEPAHEEPTTIPPEVPAEQPASAPAPEYPIPEPPQTTSEPQKSDWLARMNSQ